METYAGQLNNRKLQFEEALKMEMSLVEAIRKGVKRDVAHRELIIEALQGVIENIDIELRKEFTD